jgi:MFS family permease
LVAILCTATFMSSLDLFIVNVALRAIGAGVGETSLANLSWILNGYAIVFAALLVPAGRLADRYGVKEAFLAGLALFSLAGLGCAISSSLCRSWRCAECRPWGRQRSCRRASV